MQKHLLYANVNKYQFHLEEVRFLGYIVFYQGIWIKVRFLGYIIFYQGIWIKEEQIKVVCNWPEP